MYNGIRHFVFVLPPLAVLGGLAGAFLVRMASQRWRFAPIVAAIVFIAGIGTPVVEMVRLHPYEYTYFNRLSGGVAHARDRFMLDYWGLSLEAGLASAAGEACRARRNEAPRPPLEDCGLRAAPLAAGRARPRFRNDVGSGGAPTSR